MTNISLKNIKVKKSPIDTIIKGVILGIEKKTYTEILDEEQLKKFKSNPKYVDGTENQLRLLITFECEFEGSHFRGVHNMPYYEEPTQAQDMGKLINKYGNNIDVGSEVNIHYDSNGIGRISL